MIRQFNMDKAHTTSTPMIVLDIRKYLFRLKEDDEEVFGDGIPYLSTIGALFTPRDSDDFTNDDYSKIKGPEKQGYVRLVGRMPAVKANNANSSTDSQTIHQLKSVVNVMLNIIQEHIPNANLPAVLSNMNIEVTAIMLFLWALTVQKKAPAMTLRTPLRIAPPSVSLISDQMPTAVVSLANHQSTQYGWKTTIDAKEVGGFIRCTQQPHVKKRKSKKKCDLIIWLASCGLKRKKREKKQLKEKEPIWRVNRKSKSAAHVEDVQQSAAPHPISFSLTWSTQSRPGDSSAGNKPRHKPPFVLFQVRILRFLCGLSAGTSCAQAAYDRFQPTFNFEQFFREGYKLMASTVNWGREI
ncbi:LOW QUALITY PROTEIN: hypothetical protein OSB04_003304 [Centaurea solstitialis]|uniref:Uncharacterized protein n=1 Tax=Centaurea solstitialis TaxID=347529 RepID=A0AA38UCC7_9ASTR|nr:LOW QUALITY PROTEIN: hypothetical protein OSB04_003304 [Centaurea solstitialis]